MEAYWKTFEFPMHGRSHAVVRLKLHMPNLPEFDELLDELQNQPEDEIALDPANEDEEGNEIPIPLEAPVPIVEADVENAAAQVHLNDEQIMESTLTGFFTFNRENPLLTNGPFENSASEKLSAELTLFIQNAPNCIASELYSSTNARQSVSKIFELSMMSFIRPSTQPLLR